MAKDCWSKGTSKGVKGGWQTKGDSKGGYPGKGNGYLGKGGPPRDGCFTCGGPHWAKDCPKGKGKGKGKGVNGVDEGSPPGVIGAGTGEMSLGGGKGGGDQAQVEWDYQQSIYGQQWDEFYSLDYGHEWLSRPRPPLPKDSVVVENEWSNVSSLKKNRFNKLEKSIVKDDELRFEKDCADVNRRLTESIQKVKQTEKMTEDVILNVSGNWEKTVSYTHLTLPTIYSV